MTYEFKMAVSPSCTITLSKIEKALFCLAHDNRVKTFPDMKIR